MESLPAKKKSYLSHNPFKKLQSYQKMSKKQLYQIQDEMFGKITEARSSVDTNLPGSA